MTKKKSPGLPAVSRRRIREIVDKIHNKQTADLKTEEIAQALLMDEVYHFATGYDSSLGLALAARVVQEYRERHKPLEG